MFYDIRFPILHSLKSKICLCLWLFFDYNIPIEFLQRFILQIHTRVINFVAEKSVQIHDMCVWKYQFQMLHHVIRHMGCVLHNTNSILNISYLRIIGYLRTRKIHFSSLAASEMCIHACFIMTCVCVQYIVRRKRL